MYSYLIFKQIQFYFLSHVILRFCADNCQDLHILMFDNRINYDVV